MNNLFWFENPQILLTQLNECYPKNTLTYNQNLNSIVRLSIIIGIIFALLANNLTYLFFCICTSLIITYILYTINNPSNNIEKFDGSINITKNKKDENGDNCILPTVNNPFGNMLPGDDPTKIQTCKQSDPETKDLTEKYFKLGLYTDVNDVWDKNNSQRQYNTMPSTQVPNDRDTWAKWCFSAPSCRDGDMEYCLRTNSILIP